MPWLRGKHLYFVLCKRQKESDDSIDENVDVHKEYCELDLISVAKDLLKKLIEISTKNFIFSLFVCQDFLYYRRVPR